jgi:hypothetical protein
MALTMTRTKQFGISLALAALVSGGAVCAQINPATAKSMAQSGAQTANTSATQSQSTSAAAKPSQTSATNPKNNMSASATQTPAQNSAPAKKTPAEKQAATDKKIVKADKKAAASTAAAQPQKTVPPAKDAKPAGDVTKTTKPTLPQGRRDPFITLIGKQTGAGPALSLPPGKGGLQVSTLVLQGIVSGPNGMIAVVANPQKSVYFLRVGDELFDGRVEKIEISGVLFHEVGKDAFGKPVEREVTRKLNPSSGEQP